MKFPDNNGARPRMVITVDPMYKDFVERLRYADGEPYYEEVINLVEGFIYSEYGALPERRLLYTGHAPFCAWAAARHGLLRLCLRCEDPPFTLVYYTDPELLDHLREYLGLMPGLVDPLELRRAVRLDSVFNAEYACVWAAYYTLCLSRRGDPLDEVVAKELFGESPEQQTQAQK